MQILNRVMVHRESTDSNYFLFCTIFWWFEFFLNPQQINSRGIDKKIFLHAIFYFYARVSEVDEK